MHKELSEVGLVATPDQPTPRKPDFAGGPCFLIILFSSPSCFSSGCPSSSSAKLCFECWISPPPLVFVVGGQAKVGPCFLLLSFPPLHPLPLLLPLLLTDYFNPCSHSESITLPVMNSYCWMIHTWYCVRWYCPSCFSTFPVLCVHDTCPVSAHPLGAVECLMLVHVGSQDKGLGTPSRYLAKTISWNACQLYFLVLCLGADLSKLKVLEAVIKETLRLHATAPLGSVRWPHTSQCKMYTNFAQTV